MGINNRLGIQVVSPLLAFNMFLRGLSPDATMYKWCRIKPLKSNRLELLEYLNSNVYKRQVLPAPTIEELRVALDYRSPMRKIDGNYTYSQFRPFAVYANIGNNKSLSDADAHAKLIFALIEDKKYSMSYANEVLMEYRAKQIEKSIPGRKVLSEDSQIFNKLDEILRG